ncbi:MAG: energy transducer TonB [Bacteroidales bacterium]|nr:energy transducer TonB [Bacteroidales bacterium]
MKTTAFIFAFVIMSSMTYGQTNPQFQPEEFPKAQANSIYDYLINNVKYFQDAALNCIPGTEVIAFLVTPEGELTGFRVINSVSPAVDDEVIRVLKETSGSWSPGFRNGVPAGMEQEVALVFVPNGYFNIVEEAKNLLDKGNRILTVKKDPERALKYFNDAFRLRPCEESILAARSRCLYTLGDIEGAILDCSRIIELNRSQSNQLEAADPFTLMEQLMDHAEGSIAFR